MSSSPLVGTTNTARGPAYAEENFDLDAIATRFEEVLRAANRERAVT
jgi:hypothetical protein